MPKRKAKTSKTSSSKSTSSKSSKSNSSDKWALCDLCCTWKKLPSDAPSFEITTFNCVLNNEICAATGESIIGWQFKKKFNGYGMWTGQVVHYDPTSNRYVGRYVDGTDEWYTLNDLRVKFKLTKPSSKEQIQVEPWSSRSVLSPHKKSKAANTTPANNNNPKQAAKKSKKRKAAHVTKENVTPTAPAAVAATAVAAAVVPLPVAPPSKKKKKTAAAVVPLPVAPPSKKKKKTEHDGKTQKGAILIDMSSSDEDANKEDDSDDEVVLVSKEVATAATSSTSTSSSSTSSTSSTSSSSNNIELGPDEDIVMVKSTGKNPLRDYPHARHTCLVNRWQKTDSHSKCKNCYCFVCDGVASSCPAWDIHCHAFPSQEWKQARAKWKKEAPARKAAKAAGKAYVSATSSSSSSSSSTSSTSSTRCACVHDVQREFLFMKYTYEQSGRYKRGPNSNVYPYYGAGSFTAFDAKFKCTECKCPPNAAAKKMLEVQAFGNQYKEFNQTRQGVGPSSVVMAALAKTVSDGRTQVEKDLWTHLHLRGGDAKKHEVAEETKALLKHPYSQPLWQKQEECKTCLCHPVEQDRLESLKISAAFVDRIGWKTVEIGVLDVRMYLKSDLNFGRSTNKKFDIPVRNLGSNFLRHRTKQSAGNHHATCVSLSDRPSAQQLDYLNKRGLLQFPFPADFGTKTFSTMLSSTEKMMSMLNDYSETSTTRSMIATCEIDWSKANYNKRWESDMLPVVINEEDKKQQRLKVMKDLLVGENKRSLNFFFEPSSTRLPASSNPVKPPTAGYNSRAMRNYWRLKQEWESNQEARLRDPRTVSLTCTGISETEHSSGPCFEFTLNKNRLNQCTDEDALAVVISKAIEYNSSGVAKNGLPAATFKFSLDTCYEHIQITADDVVLYKLPEKITKSQINFDQPKKLVGLPIEIKWANQNHRTYTGTITQYVDNGHRKGYHKVLYSGGAEKFYLFKSAGPKDRWGRAMDEYHMEADGSTQYYSNNVHQKNFEKHYFKIKKMAGQAPPETIEKRLAVKISMYTKQKYQLNKHEKTSHSTYSRCQYLKLVNKDDNNIFEVERKDVIFLGSALQLNQLEFRNPTTKSTLVTLKVKFHLRADRIRIHNINAPANRGYSYDRLADNNLILQMMTRQAAAENILPAAKDSAIKFLAKEKHLDTMLKLTNKTSHSTAVDTMLHAVQHSRQLEYDLKKRKEAPQPIGLSVNMRNYQRESLQFMLDCETAPLGIHEATYCQIILPCGKKVYYSTTHGTFAHNITGSVKGGILGEEMGLGKTIESLACILAHPRPSKELATQQMELVRKDTAVNAAHRERIERGALELGGTLVVCKVSLVGQWCEEYVDKLKDKSLRVCEYHGSKRKKYSKQPHLLSEFDLVVTTYETLGREFSDANKRAIKKAEIEPWICELPTSVWNSEKEIDEYSGPPCKHKNHHSLQECQRCGGEVARATKNHRVAAMRRTGEVQAPIESFFWNRIIADESHVLKSMTTSKLNLFFS